MIRPGHLHTCPVTFTRHPGPGQFVLPVLLRLASYSLTLTSISGQRLQLLLFFFFPLFQLKLKQTVFSSGFCSGAEPEHPSDFLSVGEGEAGNQPHYPHKETEACGEVATDR